MVGGLAYAGGYNTGMMAILILATLFAGWSTWYGFELKMNSIADELQTIINIEVGKNNEVLLSSIKDQLIDIPDKQMEGWDYCAGVNGFMIAAIISGSVVFLFIVRFLEEDSLGRRQMSPKVQ